MRTTISIERIYDPEEASATVLKRTERHLEQIRYRAFDYFERRGQSLGNDWDDWLRAERQIVWNPPAEMFENHTDIILRVAVPGFHPKLVQVTATPQSLLVQGTEAHQHDGLELRMHFCEFGQRLFRRFDLPTRIDPNRVSATLDKGILEVLAGIARPAPKPAPGAAAGVCL